MTPVAPRIVNSVSYVTRINDEGDFSWQAQYLVKLNCHFSWQVQYLVKLNCHFSWQAQYLVKLNPVTFGRRRIFRDIWNDSRSAKFCSVQYKKCLRRAQKVTSVARQVAD